MTGRAHGAPARTRPASCCRARTSGSRPPTTTPAAAAPTPTGSTRPTPASSATARRRRRRRPRSTRATATSPTPRRSRWRPTTPPKCRPRAGVRRRSRAEACATVNPFGIPPQAYEKAFQGSLSTVGQAQTTSPWGTLDQGGNAVEWTDTITASPTGKSDGRVWRRLHGGIANAPAYQLWLSAVGLQPQDNAAFTATYPWLGFRIGVLGNLKRAGRTGRNAADLVPTLVGSESAARHVPAGRRPGRRLGSLRVPGPPAILRFAARASLLAVAALALPASALAAKAPPRGALTQLPKSAGCLVDRSAPSRCLRDRARPQGARRRLRLAGDRGQPRRQERLRRLLEKQRDRDLQAQREDRQADPAQGAGRMHRHPGAEQLRPGGRARRPQLGRGQPRRPQRLRDLARRQLAHRLRPQPEGRRADAAAGRVRLHLRPAGSGLLQRPRPDRPGRGRHQPRRAQRLRRRLRRQRGGDLQPRPRLRRPGPAVGHRRLHRRSRQRLRRRHRPRGGRGAGGHRHRRLHRQRLLQRGRRPRPRSLHRRPGPGHGRQRLPRQRPAHRLHHRL